MTAADLGKVNLVISSRVDNTSPPLNASPMVSEPVSRFSITDGSKIYHSFGFKPMSFTLEPQFYASVEASIENLGGNLVLLLNGYTVRKVRCDNSPCTLDLPIISASSTADNNPNNFYTSYTIQTGRYTLRYNPPLTTSAVTQRIRFSMAAN